MEGKSMPGFSHAKVHFGHCSFPDTCLIFGFFFCRIASTGSVVILITPRSKRLGWPSGRNTVSGACFVVPVVLPVVP